MPVPLTVRSVVPLIDVLPSVRLPLSVVVRFKLPPLIVPVVVTDAFAAVSVTDNVPVPRSELVTVNEALVSVTNTVPDVDVAFNEPAVVSVIVALPVSVVSDSVPVPSVVPTV